MKTCILRFVKDTSGATAIEYSLLAGGIALAIVVAVNSIAPKLIPTFQVISDNLK